MCESLTDIQQHLSNWQPPEDWRQIRTIDAHAAGEPLRVIMNGYPELPGNTILEKRRYAKEHHDDLRTSLMWEPRGHADMYGCVLLPPVTEEADFGILFLHNEGYSSMCGHAVIAVTKVLLETGAIPLEKPETVVRFDTPSGLVTARGRIRDGRVESVAFQNVPSYVVALDQKIEVPGLGQVVYDLAFGGAYYAYVQAASIGLGLDPVDQTELIAKGMRIKRAVMRSCVITHPFEEDLSFLYGTIFIGPPQGRKSNSRNVCVFAEGEVDRSPTGTGVSGRLAIHYARGEIGIGEPLVVESIIGSRFVGRVDSETTFGPHAAIVPEVEGTASITGTHRFTIDPRDPLSKGFLLR